MRPSQADRRPDLAIAAALHNLMACSSNAAQASGDQPEHFEGERSDTTAEAPDNLREHNAKLVAIVAQEDLSASDMTDIHRLSYTQENALARIEDEVETLAEVREEVHVASEEMDRATMRQRTPDYLSASERLLER